MAIPLLMVKVNSLDGKRNKTMAMDKQTKTPNQLNPWVTKFVQPHARSSYDATVKGMQWSKHVPFMKCGVKLIANWLSGVIEAKVTVQDTINLTPPLTGVAKGGTRGPCPPPCCSASKNKNGCTTVAGIAKWHKPPCPLLPLIGVKEI